MSRVIDRPVTERTGDWMETPGFGAYVHIPFCMHRCHYCDFNTYEGQDELHSPYVDAVIREIQMSPLDRGLVSSIFFGGGTPTLLPPAELGRIVEAIADRFGCSSDAEVTVEANPETVDVTKFRALKSYGFNRVSIGVQSLVDRVLVGLGRTHSADTARRAVEAAREAGFDDVNVDVIYGSPWESADEWTATISGVVELGPDHVSAYALTIEEATPLATLIRTGRVPGVDPDIQADRYAVTNEALSRAGYTRYEISNWAKPGRASRHNVLYWLAGGYGGFGAGAHGHVDGLRWWNVRLPRDYIAATVNGDMPEAGREIVAGDARGGEALMLGLRLRAGVPADAFGERFGDSVLGSRAAEVKALCGQGLLEYFDGRLRLTERGTFIANEVASRLL
ncbi:MAG: radical SAM family heme chaperone HemW [Actinomycetota bacterium]